MLPAVVRSLIPLIVAAATSVAGRYGLHLSNDLLTSAAGAGVATVYVALVHWLESRHSPVWGFLLGAIVRNQAPAPVESPAAAPVTVPPVTAPLDPVVVARAAALAQVTQALSDAMTAAATSAAASVSRALQEATQQPAPATSADTAPVPGRVPAPSPAHATPATPDSLGWAGGGQGVQSA